MATTHIVVSRIGGVLAWIESAWRLLGRSTTPKPRVVGGSPLVGSQGDHEGGCFGQCRCVVEAGQLGAEEGFASFDDVDAGSGLQWGVGQYVVGVVDVEV